MVIKNSENLPNNFPAEKKSLLKVVIHSFFVVPFIIAIFGVLIFLMLRILTIEPRTAQDYLHDVKIGGNTKRWQGAFELSKILANPGMVPREERFVNDLISTFEYSEKERDDRIRIYLALAMGRTKDLRYATILEKTLNAENEEILAEDREFTIRREISVSLDRDEKDKNLIKVGGSIFSWCASDRFKSYHSLRNGLPILDILNPPLGLGCGVAQPFKASAMS